MIFSVVPVELRPSEGAAVFAGQELYRISSYIPGLSHIALPAYCSVLLFFAQFSSSVIPTGGADLIG
jgi:hypothetical protein